MRWALMALIVAASTYAGYALGSKHIKRFRLYADICRFCEHYKTQISFKNAKVLDIFTGFSAGREFMPLKDFFKARDKISCNLVCEQERKEIESFLDGLGRGDITAEQQFTEGYQKIFTEKRTQCEQNKRRYASLYTKLGLLLGLLIAILLL